MSACWLRRSTTKGNFCSEQGNMIKLEPVADYDHHRSYVDKGDRMANSYSISCWTWKWMNKLFFHLFDLAILNSYILLPSCCGKKISHRNFWCALLRNMLEVAGKEWWLHRPVGRPTTTSVNNSRLDTSFKKHWPGPTKPGRCRVCSRGVTWKVHMKCLRCDAALCVDRMHYVEYHTKKRL